MEPCIRNETLFIQKATFILCNIICICICIIDPSVYDKTFATIPGGQFGDDIIDGHVQTSFPLASLLDSSAALNKDDKNSAENIVVSKNKNIQSCQIQVADSLDFIFP